MVERLVHTEEVTGSMPVSPTREDADLEIAAFIVASAKWRRLHRFDSSSNSVRVTSEVTRREGIRRCILGPFRTTISSAQSKLLRLMESVELPAAESGVVAESLRTQP